MRICHITPHLPPDQAANALLPVHLGHWARDAGDDCRYVAHEPRQTARRTGEAVELPGPVVWVPLPPRGRGIVRRLASLRAAVRIARLADPCIRTSEVVHIHSSGLLAEICAWLAARRRKPVVLTLYGTEIWHYRPRRGIDLFTRAYRSAARVTFYSRGLADRAVELGLERPGMSVVYPPVAEEFHLREAATREATRRALGVGREPLLLNVKRLHPLAGQRYLIEALPIVLKEWPSARLVICGTGPLEGELRALVRLNGVATQVRFAGLVDNETIAQYDTAADLFVLPSLLEACPTVALEALACGTPVVSSDNPGGVELAGIFGADVALVPRGDASALATAILNGVNAGRRTLPSTATTIEQRLRPSIIAAEYRAIYAGLTR